MGTRVPFPVLVDAVCSFQEDCTLSQTHACQEPSGHAVGLLATAFRVLLIDDNVDANESTGELLGLLGYQVEMADDGPSGLAACRAFEPHLILCDIGLPGMSGYELVVELRRAIGKRKVVIAAATGYGQEDDRARTSLAGFDHHLIKPIGGDALLDFVAQQAASY